jgi:ABC-type glycerol-3-phosphate transport system substrate-binding protein
MKQFIRASLHLLAILLFAGCSNLPAILDTPTPAAIVTATPTQPAEALSTPAGPVVLRLWLPPQFDPQADTPAARILNARLADFMQRNPGVRIEVRIKAVDGPASLLESLVAASQAAPGASPDLVALSRPDLEAAAQTGILHPFDGLTTLLDDPDWYACGRQMSRIQNTTFGLPFAADALLLVYRPGVIGGLRQDWEQIQQQGSLLSFAGDSPEASFALSLYLSTGGATSDDQGRPTLDVGKFAAVTTFLRAHEQDGMIPLAVTNYQDDARAWQAYRDGRANVAITWASQYLNDKPSDSLPAPLPGLQGDLYTLSTSWTWALAGTDTEKQAMAVKLAEFLTESSFLASWTEAIGLLPPRPNAMSAWPESMPREVLGQVMLSAQLLPPRAITNVLGPVIRDAGMAVLRGQNTPEDAARQAVEKLQP